MSKKVKMLVFTAVAMVVLVGALLALKFFLPEKEEVDQGFNQLTYIFDESDKEIETITVDYAGDHYVIEKLAAYQYGIAEIQDFTADPTAFFSLAGASKSIATYNEIDAAGSNLADYGLNNPQAKIAFAFKNGPTHVLLIGDKNSSGNGYYCMLEGEDIVYVLQTQTADAYLKTRSDYVDLTVIPGFDTNDEEAYPVFSYFDISRPDLEKNIYIRPMTAEEKKSDVNATAVMLMTSPIRALALNGAIQTCMYGFFGVNAQSCPDFTYTEEKASLYGFDSPQGTLHTKYDNSEVTLRVGNFVDEAKTQCYLHSSKTAERVFVVNAADISWLKVTPDDMVSPVAVQPYIQDLSQISLQMNQGKTYQFSLTHEKDENGKTDTTVTCDGKTLDTTQFKRYLQLLLYTSGETIYYGDPIPASNEVLEIQYAYNNGAESDTVKILKNTARYGVMEVNGNQTFTARLAYVDKLQTELDHLFSGEMIDTEW